MKKQKNQKDIPKEKELWFITQRKIMNHLFKPEMDYDKELDMFYLWIGGKGKVDNTIEISDSIRLDVDKKGTILGIEIEDLTKLIDKGGKI